MSFLDWFRSFLKPKEQTAPLASSQNPPNQKPAPASSNASLLQGPAARPLRTHGRRLDHREFLGTVGLPVHLQGSSSDDKPDTRNLAADIEQLKRHGLPLWTIPQDVADALKVSERTLRHYWIHRDRESVAHYVTFAIAKRSGGQRIIQAPKKKLKALLRQLQTLLVSRLPVSPYAHGFLKKRSIATNADPHVGKAVVIKLDIKDCFPTLHHGRVRGLLIGYGYSSRVARMLSRLMTESPRQRVAFEGGIAHVPVGPRVCVQGSPTSPGLCNAILRRLDFRMAGLAKKHGFAYTRYADDLTFSGSDASQAKLLITIAGRIAREEKLPLNAEKTRVMRAGQRQRVAGVTVNQEAGLSRQERRRLRAALHQQRLAAAPDPVKDRQLQGKLAYLQMLNPKQAAALLKNR